MFPILFGVAVIIKRWTLYSKLNIIKIYRIYIVIFIYVLIEIFSYYTIFYYGVYIYS